MLYSHVVPVLNPRYKLQYFKKAHWPSDWIQTARDITRDEYERTYAHHSEHVTSDSDSNIDNGIEITGSSTGDDGASDSEEESGSSSKQAKVRTIEYFDVVHTN